MELLEWYNEHGRHDLPWRATRDPYKVLVSELMLQQTQVPRVIPKYDAFLARFPTIRALAAAPRTDVLRAWQGLGYNSRAARLHALARLVVDEHDSALPTTEDGLRALPGIGPYTAAAVMAFAHHAPSAPMDVNVERVLARRYFTRRQRPTRERLKKLALTLAEAHDPHDLYSALMDLGSRVCTATPRCAMCPLRSSCKSKGVRPDEKKRRQPAFNGSTRWWRGRIVTALLERPRTEHALAKALHADGTFTTALAALEREGIVVRGKTLRIA